MSTARAPIPKSADRRKSASTTAHGPNGHGGDFSQLENALWALRHNFKVLPLQMGGKDPNGLLVPTGSKESTRDEEQVRKWFAQCPNGNVGINGGVIVDCDEGITSLAEAEAWREKVGLPPTLAVRTGRRTSYGIQFHYSGETKTGSYELHGVSGEVRSGNTYGLAPGSVHPDSGARYEVVIDLPIAPYPADSKLEQQKKKTAKKLSQDPSKLKSGEKIKKSSRQYWLVSQCGRLRRTGLGGDALFAALCALRDKYCDRPEEKTDAMLRQICESGERNYGVAVPGLDSRGDGEGERERPTIQIEAGRTAEITDAAEEVLVQHAKRLKMFQRGSDMVEIVTTGKPEEDARLLRPAGTVMLKPMSLPTLMETLESLVDFQKWSTKKKEVVSVNCPPRIAATYLARSGKWRLPALRGTIGAPVMREDGTLLMEDGYDDATELFLVSPCNWLPVPEHPTLQDAKKALEILHAPFAEFPFCAGEDRAVEIATILTAIQRRVLPACPIVGFSAPAPRSGKGKLAAAPAIISTGKAAPASACSPDKEEFRKMLTAALREGLPIINLDNVEIPLQSADLCRAITEPEYSDRLLGENRTLTLPTNSLWTATGNNLAFRGDLSSRALLSRIDAKLENPEERNFRIQDFETYLLEHRAELVRAALTILRAFYVAGSPRQVCPNWGGFESWSRRIREPLLWAGETDPCLTRRNVLAKDPEKESAINLLEQLRKVFEDSHFTAAEITEKAADTFVDDRHRYHFTHAGLRDALKVVVGGGKELDSKKIGFWMRAWKDRPAGGLLLSRANSGSTSTATWRVGRPEPAEYPPDRGG